MSCKRQVPCGNTRFERRYGAYIGNVRLHGGKEPHLTWHELDDRPIVTISPVVKLTEGTMEVEMSDMEAVELKRSNA